MKMYDNILKKVAIYEEKRGITYAKTDGNLYKWLKAFYIIGFSATLLMNLFYVIGVSLSERTFNNMRNQFYTVLALSAVLIVALVFICLKKYVWMHIPAFVLNLLSGVGLILTFAPLMELPQGGYPGAFYLRHLAPLCLVVFFSAWVVIIAIRAYCKQKKTYKKIVENIYNIHHKTIEENDFSEEEWEEILKSV